MEPPRRRGMVAGACRARGAVDDVREVIS